MGEFDSSLHFEFPPFYSLHKDGRFERHLLSVAALVPASLDAGTSGVLSRDVVIPADESSGVSVPARIFLPSMPSDAKRTKLPVVVFFHGGAFMFESVFSGVYHGFVGSLAAKAEAVFVSVEYRLAPDHPLPAAYIDASRSLQWVLSHADGNVTEPWLANFVDFERVFVAGDSAGGNIAHNVIAMHEQGLGGVTIRGAVLIQPFFWGPDRQRTEMVEDEQRILQPAFLDAISEFLFPVWEEDPRLNPLGRAAPGLAKLGCRRVLVVVSDRDLLCERGRMYYQKLVDCEWNGEAELYEAEGEDHTFYILNPDSDKVPALMAKLVSFINKDAQP